MILFGFVACLTVLSLCSNHSPSPFGRGGNDAPAKVEQKEEDILDSWEDCKCRTLEILDCFVVCFVLFGLVWFGLGPSCILNYNGELMSKPIISYLGALRGPYCELNHPQKRPGVFRLVYPLWSQFWNTGATFPSDRRTWRAPWWLRPTKARVPLAHSRRPSKRRRLGGGQVGVGCSLEEFPWFWLTSVVKL